MAQCDVWFLEPDMLNAMTRRGESLVFSDHDDDLPHPELRAPSWPEKEVQDRYFQSVFAMDRCSWEGCDQWLRWAFIPLCREHAVRVWAYVDGREASGVHMIARRELLKDVKARESNRFAIQTRPGWIYYLQVGNLIKIGFTYDLDRRVAQYPPNVELLAFHAGTWELEQALHRRFSLEREKGREWYRPSEIMMQHVRRAIELTPTREQYLHAYISDGSLRSNGMSLE